MKDPISRKVLSHFKTQSKIFKMQLSAIHRHPTKKGVHQLRITTRRLRAVLWLTAHGSHHLSFGKLPGDLRQLGRALGRLREIDVAMEDADEYLMKARTLKKKRRNARKNLLKETSAKHRKKLTVRLGKALNKIQKHQAQSIAPGTALLRKKLVPWTKKKLLTQDDFHRLRIDVKKVRYVLEATGKPVLPLRELQDVLGKVHDLEVLQTLLKKDHLAMDASKEHSREAVTMLHPALNYAIAQLR